MGKKALCVGVNNFKNFPGAALRGCVNDVQDMSSLLQELFGFANKDITILTDADATKANIMNNLEAMVDEAKAGKYNYIVFSFSSHGTQVPDLSGDEDDAADEAFCPHDLDQAGDAWDPNFIITDDELHDLFATLPENVILEVYLDTCHSGTGVRAIDFLLTRKPRYMPPPSLQAFKQIEGRASRGLARKFIQLPVVHHVLWAGCRSEQTSADALIENNWHGAFTYFFCKQMRACQNRLSRKEIITKVRGDLAAGNYTQIPQLECDATRRNESVASLLKL
ncbi:MAG: caspase family protein [Desulfocapsa sp.]|nr:caspase family protein [Desulfocapsa sp.]